MYKGDIAKELEAEDQLLYMAFKNAIIEIDDFDINIVVQALRMLFNSDIFQITVSTYGA